MAAVELEGADPITNNPSSPLPSQLEEDELEALDLEDIADRSESRHAGEVSTLMMTFIMTAEVIGAGVLSLPHAYVRLGWLPATFVNFGMFLITTYTGLLIFRTRSAYPEVRSYPQLFRKLVGKRGQVYASICVYSILFLYICGFAIVQADSVKVLFPTFGTFEGALAAAMFSFAVLQARTMPNVAWLSVFSIITIVIPLVLSIYSLNQMVKNEPEMFPVGDHHLFGSNFLDALVGVMSFVYSYAGHAIYFELIAEMAEPADFPKSLVVSQIGVVMCYTVVGSVVYGIVGKEGTLKDVVQVMVIAHTALSVAVNGIIFVRAIQNRFEPRIKLRRARKDGLNPAVLPAVEPPTSNSKNAILWWALWSSLTAATLYGVIILVRFFDLIAGVGAALIASQTNITWPAYFDNLTFGTTRGSPARIAAMRTVNVVLAGLGIFFLVGGLVSSIIDVGHEAKQE